MVSGFTGFPPGCEEFFVHLKENNSKLWFEDNREWYNSDVLFPAQQFVVVLGERLKAITPGIIADPRIDRSIFRLHRDVRFTKSKEPYKTNLGIWFWEGNGKKMDCSGYYIGIEPGSLFLGAGMYMMEPPLLNLYRELVVDPKFGKELADVVRQIKSHNRYHFGFKKYQRVPRGFDATHPNAEFLMYSGIYAGYEENAIPPVMNSPESVEFCFEIIKDLSPMHGWVHQLLDEFNKRRNR